MKKDIFNSKILLLDALVLFIVLSCTPGSCFEETNAYIKAGFALSENGKSTTPDSLTLYGSGKPSQKLYNRTIKPKTALMPLDASSISTGFIIRINGITDTLTIWYSSFPHLVSKECGYTFYHNIDSVNHTTYNIEDIIVRNRTVTTFDGENIRIFF